MGHWYKKDGTPFYTIKRADGNGERDVTIRDAKKVGAYYSVTSVIGIPQKPMLEKWKLNQMLNAVVELDDSNIRFTNKEAWLAGCWELYTNNIEQYAKRGTEIHDSLEQYFKTKIVSDKDEAVILPAIVWAEFWDPDEFISEQSFAHSKGYGGKIDLIMKIGDKTIIVDFKTKQGDTLSKQVYEDYAMQLAAYRQAIDPKADCYNLMISTTHPGVIHAHKWSEEDLEHGLKMFNTLLEFTKLKNRYDPCTVDSY